MIWIWQEWPRKVAADHADDTVQLRLLRLERVLRLNQGAIGALVTLITLFAALKLGESAGLISRWISVAAVAVILMAALLLLYSRGKVEWQRDLLRRVLRFQASINRESPLEVAAKLQEELWVSWNLRERRARKGGFLLLALGGVLLLAQAAASAVESPPSKPSNPQVVSTFSGRFALFFDSDSSSLSQDEVERFAQALRGVDVDSLYASIRAFADTVGSPDYNIRLAERRAAEVARILVGLGFSATRVSVSAFGETQSPTDGESSARRTDVIVATMPGR